MYTISDSITFLIIILSSFNDQEAILSSCCLLKAQSHNHMVMCEQ